MAEFRNNETGNVIKVSDAAGARLTSKWSKVEAKKVQAKKSEPKSDDDK